MRSRRLRLALAGALAGVVAVLVLSLTRTDEPATPPSVEPIRAGSTPAEAARNLSAWLRANSG